MTPRLATWTLILSRTWVIAWTLFFGNCSRDLPCVRHDVPDGGHQLSCVDRPELEGLEDVE